MAAKRKSSSKSSAVEGLAYLVQPAEYPLAGVCAVFGDDGWLRREVLMAVRRVTLGDEEGEFSLSTFAGNEVELRDVTDALSTVSLFGDGRRLCVVESADSFVSNYRAELEAYVERPAAGGVLVLDVSTWPGNTRLAKAVAASGLAIDCRAPDNSRIGRWLGERAKTAYDIKLPGTAADAMLELLPSELGILDQELARLALLAGDGSSIDVAMVREHVGPWRTRKTWDMIDAAADGRAAEAIEQLDRLLAAGEQPIGLLAQASSTLRKFAAAARIVDSSERAGSRTPLRAALKQAGIPPFKLSDAERQLRQIGRQRALELSEWLLACDLGMKGHNSTPLRARFELERLVARLSTAASERGAKTAAR